MCEDNCLKWTSSVPCRVAAFIEKHAEGKVGTNYATDGSILTSYEKQRIIYSMTCKIVQASFFHNFLISQFNNRLKWALQSRICTRFCLFASQ